MFSVEVNGWLKEQRILSESVIHSELAKFNTDCQKYTIKSKIKEITNYKLNQHSKYQYYY